MFVKSILFALLLLCKSYLLLSQLMHKHYIPFRILLNFSFAQFPILLLLLLSTFSNWIEKPQNKVFYVVKRNKLSLPIGAPSPLDVIVLAPLSLGSIGWDSPGAASVLRLSSSSLLWCIPFFLTLYPTLSCVTPSFQWILSSSGFLRKDVQELKVLRSCLAEDIFLKNFLNFILEHRWFTMLC